MKKPHIGIKNKKVLVFDIKVLSRSGEIGIHVGFRFQFLKE